jgi:hypothetical protein
VSEGDSPVQVQVLVADDRRDAIDEVAGALADAGLRDASSLRGVGVITGTVDDASKVDSLLAVDGVESVEKSQQVGVPAPDEPVQ